MFEANDDLWDFAAFDFVQEGFDKLSDFYCLECGEQLLQQMDSDLLYCPSCELNFKIDQ